MRLIDADAIPYTMLYKEDWMRGIGKETLGAWKSDIDNMPTIEPKCADGCLYGWGSDECEGCLFTIVKAKRGRWIEEYNGNGWNDYWDYTCSACEETLKRGEPYPYCPNCGARME